MTTTPPRLGRLLTACHSTVGASADRLVRWQHNTVGALVTATVVLILFNVVTRALNVALFWVDARATT